jgi:hypothetical protein
MHVGGNYHRNSGIAWLCILQPCHLHKPAIPNTSIEFLNALPTTMVSSKMSIDSLLNPTTGHCKRSSCGSCYHASEIWVTHSKYRSFESHTPPNDQLNYARSLRVAKKSLIWPKLRTDRAIVRVTGPKDHGERSLSIVHLAHAARNSIVRVPPVSSTKI